MKIAVKYIGKVLTAWGGGKKEEEIVLEDPASLEELLNELVKRYGDCPLPHSNLMALINGKSAKLYGKLQDGDLVVLAPIAVGG